MSILHILRKPLNTDGHLPGRTTHLEEAEGIKEKLDPKMKEFFDDIKRGDLGVPHHALKAGAFQYAKQCNGVNQEFMLCKKETLDPRACVKEGLKVSDCAADFYKSVTETCGDSLVAFGKCLELSTHREYLYCRAEQMAFDSCLFKKMGMDKDYDALKYGTTIKTERPKPRNPFHLKNFDYPHAEYPDWERKFPVDEK